MTKDPKDGKDTASIPGEDLREQGLDLPDMLTGLQIVWASQEWGRLGETTLIDSPKALSVGRGEESPGGHPRAFWAQQQPGEHRFMPPLRTTITSGDQLLVKAATRGLELNNIGKYPMHVNGRQVARGTVEPGDLVYLFGQFLFQCVWRPVRMRRPQHLLTRFVGPFGEANAFDMVGEGAMAASLKELLAYASKSPEHVLLHGESGTGKESAAKMIHGMGPNPAAPFVKLSAANLSPSLLQAQLFGHCADYPQMGMKARLGAFGAANGGTLFLDEIGRLPPEWQAALLRVLDQGEYMVLGEDKPARSHFRLIGAMNGPLAALMLDLNKRLSLKIDVPGLIDRLEDIPLLVRHLLRKTHASSPELTKHLLRKQVDGSEEVVPPVAFMEELMLRRSFDGNVRDLLSAVSTMLYETAPVQGGGEGEARVPTPSAADEPYDAKGRVLTKEQIEWALGKHGGNVSAAARELDVTRPSLYRAMERVGLRGR